jgi:glycosyltransferase involved in cell wall biosynthesis
MISIIIPTYNRSNYLETTLISILKSDFDKGNFEIIIVDNGSTDDTKAVVHKLLESRAFKFKYFYEPEPGLLSARHKGAEESQGDILTFIDDDVEVSCYWLNSIHSAFNNNSTVSLLTGPCLPKYEIYPPNWLNHFWSETPYGGKECSWLSLLDLGANEIEIHPNWVWGLNFSIRQDAFTLLEGFHPDNIKNELQHFQGNGETGLAMKAADKGLKAMYHPGVLLYHQVTKDRLSVDYFKKRAYYAGVSMSFTDLRQGKTKNNKHEKDVQKPNSRSVEKKIRRLYRVLFPLKQQKKNPTIDKHIELMLVEIENEGKKGYEFHQHAFHSNEKVRSWVLQKNYMNYKLPL